MRSSGIITVTLALILSITSLVRAELHDRGGGLIYDDVLDITWLQDASYARTSGYDVDGGMSWDQAMEWVQNLAYYDSVRDVTWTDWRLPRTLPVNGSHYVYEFSVDGTTDRGFNTSSTASELGHLFYTTLGNLAYAGTDGSYPRPGYGLVKTGPFVNLLPLAYWSESEFELFLGHAWGFVMLTGTQHTGVKDLEFLYAWAVRDGDVGLPVEPEIRITSPANATTQSGVITVSAAVSGFQAQRVIFVVAGKLICVDLSAPFACEWDTTIVPNGAVRLFAIATDADNNKLRHSVVVGIIN